jgi:HlyD family secretion protein
VKPTGIITIIIGIAILVGGTVAATKMHARASTNVTQYKVTAADTGTVKKTVSATGTLQPWTKVDIKSKAGGEVKAVLVDAGSIVTKNQVLARIDPTDTLLSYNTAKADVDSGEAKELQSDETFKLQQQQSKISIENSRAALTSAIANREAARARLDTAASESQSQPALTKAAISSAEANYENAVKQRKQLDSSNSQERATSQAALDQASANERNMQLTLDRQKTLLDKGYVAQQAVDQAQANEDMAVAQRNSAQEKVSTLDAEQQSAVEAADARVDQAKAQWQNAQASQVDVTTRKQAVMEAQAAFKQGDAQVVQAKAELDQAIANQANDAIRRYDVAQSKAAEQRNDATLQNAKTTLDQTTVRAPSDGIILTKYVDAGTMITSGLSLNSTGTSIVQLGDISRMYVDVPVDETDIANVDEKQNVDVSFDAYPGVAFSGTVARIDPQADVIQNVTTFHVRVEIDNSAPSFRLLRPGMNATCDFVIDKKEDALSIPSDAMRTDDKGTFVEIATGGHMAPADPKSDTPPDPNTLVDVKIEHRPIETGLEGNDTVEVTSGLKAGEKVVTETIEPTVTQTTSPFGGGRGGGFGGGGGRR